MPLISFLAALAALVGIISSSGGNDSDEPEDDAQHDEPAVEDSEEEAQDNLEEDTSYQDDERSGEDEESALKVKLTFEEGLDQSVIDAAIHSAELIEAMMQTAEEAGEQHTINVHIQSSQIDGEGSVAGQAQVVGGDEGGLVETAYITMDEDDVEALSANGVLDEVMDHEMLHAIGFGTTWNSEGLLTLTDDGLIFTGDQATAVYSEMTGQDEAGVPVDTSYGHWDAGSFDHDLMEATVSSESDIGQVTIASLDDIGIPVRETLFDGSEDIDMLYDHDHDDDDFFV